jgi:flagellar M-ring protein FliF
VNQLRELFRNLSWGQRIWIAVAVVAVVGGVTALVRANRERDFKPLFTSLSAEDAGALLAKLREAGVDYRLADNGSTVLAPSARVAELRLEMASAGLPKSGRIGFELFDKSNFGASDFAEQVNYHRAIEGELERSVMSIREVAQARVHVSMAKDSLYTESRQPAKASVLVKLRAAGSLSPQNVAAITLLAASAVPGLSADQVSVIDTSGNLLGRPKPSGWSDGAETSEAALEYRKGVERDLQNKIAMTLEPLLGADHFRTGVSADVDLTSGEQTEEVFDPQKSVMVTSQRTEDGPALPSASGVPGTASTLPPPASRPSTGASNYARKTENTTYQSSRLVKLTRLPRGAVKRMSLAVLVDHTAHFDKGQRIIDAPSADKLKVIRDLVAAATGLDMARGDQLVVEAFPFESTLTAEPPGALPVPAPVAANPGMPLPPWLTKLMEKSWFRLAAIGAGAVLALGMLALVWFGLRRSKLKAELAAAALEAGKQRAIGQSPEDVQRAVEERMAAQAADRARKEAEALMALKVPAVVTKKTETLTKHIAAEAKTQPAALAQVVRSWLNG